MKSNATGCIDQLPNGRWRLRMIVRGKRETIDTYDTQSLAEEERDAFLEVLHSAPANATSIGEWLDEHLTAREETKLYRDADGDRGWFDRHVKKDKLARVALKSVQPYDVDAFVERLWGARLGRGSLLKVLNVVRVGMKTAQRKGLLKTDPFLGFKLPAQKRTETEWTYAVVTEQDALVSAARAHRRADENDRLHGIPIESIIDFAMGSGLRAGELVTLRLADLHLDVAEPYATVRYGTAPDLPTKTGRIREVPIFGRALAAARVWLAAMPVWLKKNPNKLVFPGLYGAFRDENHVLRWDDWKAILKRAGITRRFRWHDLRHTCASSLISGFWGRRWSLEEVMGMLGHTDIKTTQRYAHLAPTALKLAGAETQKAVVAADNPGVSQVTNGSRTFPAKPTPIVTVVRKNSAKSSSAPDTIRTCDLRFRKGLVGSGKQGAFEADDPLMTCAGSLLRLVADEGADEADALRAARELAQAIVGMSGVRLAFEVLAGGPHALDRAVDLASQILVEADAAVGVAEASS